MVTRPMLAGLAVAIAAPVAASASVIQDLYIPGWDQVTANGGQGRGVYFRADEQFSIDGVRGYGNLTHNVSYEFVLFSAPAGSESTSGLSTVMEKGPAAFVANNPTNTAAWFEADLDFTFTAGNEYILVLRRTDGANLPNTFPLIDISSHLVGGSMQDQDLGVVRLMAGRGGFNGENNNTFFSPLLQLIIPEPTSLVALGLLALGATVRPRG